MKNIINNLIMKVNDNLPEKMNIAELIDFLELKDAHIHFPKMSNTSSIFITNKEMNKVYLQIKNNKVLFFSYPHNTDKLMLKALLLKIKNTIIEL